MWSVTEQMKAKTGTASTIWRSLAVKGKNFGGRIAKLSVIVKIQYKLNTVTPGRNIV